METRQNSGPRSRWSFAVLLATGALVGAGAPAATAATQNLHVTASPNAQATRPVSITATGQVGIDSTIAIYAAPSSVGCAPDVTAEAARGATLVDRRAIPPGGFGYSANFTPAAAGNYDICSYVDGSAAGMVEHQNQSFTISVAPAPAAPPATPPAPAPTPPRPSAGLAPSCTVPNLKRHTLRGAAHFLAVAHCKLGRVYRPSAASRRAARKRVGGTTPAEIVVSQSPAASTVYPGGYTVAVRLGFGPAPRTSSQHPTP